MPILRQLRLFRVRYRERAYRSNSHSTGHLLFASSIAIAREFTRPVVISRLSFGGEITTAIGTFVIVNKNGWALTAAHILDLIQNNAVSARKVAQYEAAVTDIENDPTITPSKKRHALKRLTKPNAGDVRRSSQWFAPTNAQIAEAYEIKEADIALIRLEPFDPSTIHGYPVFKDSTKPLPQGTSLCRLGYPFHSASSTYDAGTNTFQLSQGTVPPLFPIEGILTRLVEVGTHPKGFRIGFLETSSPGLMGQSGGPIFDVQGTVWGIQSRTIHLHLGFSPPVPGGKGEKEHQFLNLGWGVHPETVSGLLDEKGIEYARSQY